ncbi:hypothetical protein HG530_009728 [Fusarium avenaceum]|nr:hypothetical protein HG530_009728 [Fusarium avenaceum]
MLPTYLLEEERSAVTKGTSVGDLRKEADTSDLSTAKIAAAETVPVRGAGSLLDLKLVGVDHEGDGIVVIDVVLRVGKSLEGFLCFLKLNLDGGSKEDEEDEGSQPEKTADKHHAVSPSRSRPAVQHGADDVGQSTETVEALLPVGRDLVSIILVEIGACALRLVSWLTNGPKGSALVRLEALPDGVAVLIGCSLKSFIGKGLIMKIHVLEMVESSISALDVGVDLPGVLSGGHC